MDVRQFLVLVGVAQADFAPPSISELVLERPEAGKAVGLGPRSGIHDVATSWSEKTGSKIEDRVLRVIAVEIVRTDRPAERTVALACQTHFLGELVLVGVQAARQNGNSREVTVRQKFGFPLAIGRNRAQRDRVEFLVNA